MQPKKGRHMPQEDFSVLFTTLMLFRSMSIQRFPHAFNIVQVTLDSYMKMIYLDINYILKLKYM